MSNTCHKCGKPVYFAERKTSLGKDWHPNCLKCEECGKVLTPGQHAEHKGKPYCHQPCYAFNFGPKMMGYGSNVVSPANFKRGQHGTLYNGDYDFDLKKVYESPSPKAKNGASTQHKSSSVYEKSKLTKEEQISGTKQNFNGNNQQERPRSEIFMMGMNNSLPSSRAVTQSSKIDKRQQLIQKIKDFNTFYEGKKRQPVVFKDDNDNLVIQGPLRIYWGVEKPIKLQKFDDVPTNSSLGHANWRHSYMPGDSVPEFSGTSNERSDVKESPPSSPRLSRGVDDSMIFTPPEGVVMRKRNIKKFNTVAYRGDSRPNKWKRASINGHIYNYDTGVFTPVIGSCTSVTVDSHCTTDGVIRTLLEKFKIENKPSDFSLYMVSEKKGETLLRSSDIPLLERIALGPDEKSGAKLFLKDHLEMPRKGSLLNFTVPEEEEPDEAKADELTPVVAIEQRLPEEIEQLVALPEPVLQGILIKFKADEETDIRSVKARYGLVRKKILEQINKLKTAVK